AGVGDDNPGLKTSAGEVKVGTPSKGNLTGAKWQDNYTLNLTNKGPITIIIKRTGGTLVPQCALFGANNQEIIGCSLDETFSQAILKNFQVPGPGQYSLTVFRDGKTDGGTTGAYEIDITQGPAQ